MPPTDAMDLPATARRLAAVLWREHTVYRERDGGIVIRNDDVCRWISLRIRGKDAVQLRAGRILDGGTTAPARAEAIAHTTDQTRLAAVCRGLLADVAAETGTSTTTRKVPTREPRRRRRPGALTIAALIAVLGALAIAIARQGAF